MKSVLLNFDDQSVKRAMMSKIGVLSGLWEVTLKKHRPRRSLDQNSYYHAALVEPFRDWLEENWGERIDHEQAHETLKLSVMDIDRIEGIAIMPSTRKLQVDEFSMFIEKAAEFLATKCGIIVLSSEQFFEPPERGQSSRIKPTATPKRDTQAQG